MGWVRSSSSCAKIQWFGFVISFLALSHSRTLLERNRSQPSQRHLHRQLALFDPLLRRPPLVVEPHHRPKRAIFGALVSESCGEAKRLLDTYIAALTAFHSAQTPFLAGLDPRAPEADTADRPWKLHTLRYSRRAGNTGGM